ncbi:MULTISPECIES: DUF6233 domain-containing protein [unclassified Streptomyces]|uniref:DUF6233 domain-containing protein n=1 Tax=unclassified Streptomyces TaxID=2593676 RepID=UPI003811CD0E
MYELPSDLERLRVIRLYLQLQIDAVDARIRKAEAGVRPRRRPAPARAWRLQSVPDPQGGPGRGVVHRDDCRVPGGGRLSAKEFEIALGMPEVGVCGICRPDRGALRS